MVDSKNAISNKCNAMSDSNNAISYISNAMPDTTNNRYLSLSMQFKTVKMQYQELCSNGMSDSNSRVQ